MRFSRFNLDVLTVGYVFTTNESHPASVSIIPSMVAVGRLGVTSLLTGEAFTHIS